MSKSERQRVSRVEQADIIRDRHPKRLDIVRGVLCPCAAMQTLSHPTRVACHEPNLLTCLTKCVPFASLSQVRLAFYSAPTCSPPSPPMSRISRPAANLAC